MKGELNVLQIEELLRKQEVGRIGCTLHGRIHIIPVTYAYDGSMVYWLAPVGLDMAALREKPDVCFEVELMPDLGNWQYVLAWGGFRELTGADEQAHALKCLSKNHHADISGSASRVYPEWPFVPRDTTFIAEGVYAIHLRHKTGGFEVFESEGSRVHVC